MVLRELITKIGFKVDDTGLTKIESGVSNLKTSLKGLGVLVASASASVGYLLNKAGQQEQTLIAFETMLGSADKAVKLLKEIKDFADVTPFETDEVVRASKGLLAFGVATEDIIEKTRNLGNIASGVGKDKFETLVRGFGKIKVKGKASMEELNMFLEAGVPILDELAKGVGVTKAELFKMVSTGKIGFNDVDEALKRLSTGNGKFAGLMEKQSKSYLGLWSTILGKIDNLTKDLGAKLLPAGKEVFKIFLELFDKNRTKIIDVMTKAIEGLVAVLVAVFEAGKRFWSLIDGLVNLFTDWGTVIKFTAIALGTLFGAQMLIGIGQLAQGIFMLIKGMTLFGNAALLAQAKALLIPLAIGAALVGLGLIIEDIIAFFNGEDSITGVVVKKFTSLFDWLGEKLDEFTGWVSSLGDMLAKPFDFVAEKIRGTLSLMKNPLDTVTDVVSKGGDFLGDVLSGDFSGAFGFGGPEDSPATGNNSSANIKNEVNVTVPEGLTPEQASVATQQGVKEALGGMFRETNRQFATPVVE